MSPAAHRTSSDQAEIERAKLEVYKKDVKEIVEVAYAKIDEIQRHETSIPDSEAHYLSQRAIEWQAHMKSEATKDALERVEHPAHVIHNLWVMRRQVERLELEWWQKIDWSVERIFAEPANAHRIARRATDMIDLQVVERYVDTITSLALEKVREQLLHVFYLASLPARDAKELVDKWEAKMLTLERESRALGSRIIAGNLSKLKARIACVERYEDFTWRTSALFDKNIKLPTPEPQPYTLPPEIAHTEHRPSSLQPWATATPYAQASPVMLESHYTVPDPFGAPLGFHSEYAPPFDLCHPADPYFPEESASPGASVFR
ncbi:hypothetical protein BMF94_3831 [Rhodotorula taiwanensis]|uniref:Uncharacterized protein n=1 Tax=Rhodotorula taiwanensis TaxID=741276 RepID=A0A2S5B8N6_9BASI|nr:hypothetical protein BMF94_3831 [Rhodotorula taiwanensis]